MPKTQTAPIPSFAGYKILLEVGVGNAGGAEGGMARVFKAKHVASGTTRAIKLLRPEFAAKPSWVQLFYQEAELLAACSHRNVLRIFPDEGSSLKDGGEIHYHVLEWIEGETLIDVVRRSNLSEPEAARCASTMLGALEAVHEAGVLHCDVRPHNFMHETGTGRIVLIDFGISRRMGTPPENLPPPAGGWLFASPEHGDPQHLCPQSDLYSLGIVLYFLLTRNTPFSYKDAGGANNPQLMLKVHQGKPPRDPREFVASLSNDMHAILMRLLAKRPDDRFPAAAEARLALRDAKLNAHKAKPPPKASYLFIDEPSHLPLFASLVAVSLVLLLAVFAGIIYLATRSGQTSGPGGSGPVAPTITAEHIRQGRSFILNRQLAEAEPYIRGLRSYPLDEQLAHEVGVLESLLDTAKELDGIVSPQQFGRPDPLRLLSVARSPNGEQLLAENAWEEAFADAWQRANNVAEWESEIRTKANGGKTSEAARLIEQCRVDLGRWDGAKDSPELAALDRKLQSLHSEILAKSMQDLKKELSGLMTIVRFGGSLSGQQDAIKRATTLFGNLPDPLPYSLRQQAAEATVSVNTVYARLLKEARDHLEAGRLGSVSGLPELVPEGSPASRTNIAAAKSLRDQLGEATAFQRSLATAHSRDAVLTLAGKYPTLVRKEYAAALLKTRWDALTSYSSQFASIQRQVNANGAATADLRKALRELDALVDTYDDLESEATEPGLKRLRDYAGALRARIAAENSQEQRKVLCQQARDFLAVGNISRAGKCLRDPAVGNSSDSTTADLRVMLGLAEGIFEQERATAPDPEALLVLTRDTRLQQLLDLTHGSQASPWRSRFNAVWRRAVRVDERIREIDRSINSGNLTQATLLLEDLRESYTKWSHAPTEPEFQRLASRIDQSGGSLVEYRRRLEALERNVLGGYVVKLPDAPSGAPQDLLDKRASVASLAEAAERLSGHLGAPERYVLITVGNATSGPYATLLKQQQWQDRFLRAWRKANDWDTTVASIRKAIARRETATAKRELSRLRSRYAAWNGAPKADIKLLDQLEEGTGDDTEVFEKYGQQLDGTVRDILSGQLPALPTAPSGLPGALETKRNHTAALLAAARQLSKYLEEPKRGELLSVAKSPDLAYTTLMRAEAWKARFAAAWSRANGFASKVERIRGLIGQGRRGKEQARAELTSFREQYLIPQAPTSDSVTLDALWRQSAPAEPSRPTTPSKPVRRKGNPGFL